MAVRSVVGDEGPELTALFRYSLARQAKLEKWEQYYEGGAAIECMWNRSHLIDLSEGRTVPWCLPEDFAERAPVIYKSVFPSFGEAPSGRFPEGHYWPEQFM